ncbi:MAG: tetratricopeptide repeat protein [Gemmatales bacterium]|nr:tetratricopeptide repeat protein [Gemmatales bacterium]MDW8388145.1 tetratricopeptide repeat protein [Gemmatales bacterium]
MKRGSFVLAIIVSAVGAIEILGQPPVAPPGLGRGGNLPPGQVRQPGQPWPGIGVPRSGPWCDFDPDGPPPRFRCCGPIFWQPYCIPPVVYQSFSIQVTPAPVVGVPNDLLINLLARQAAQQAQGQAQGEAEPNDRPPVRPIRPAKARDAVDMRADMQKLLRKGNDAFAAGDYKQALNAYQQAVAAAPLEPTPYFHLAQAHLALNRYVEAGVAIERGMRLHPQWPQAPFQPRALYRDHAGDYERHLGALAEEVGRNINDESLLFLLAYQLWFDGRREDAVTLFRRAAALAHDTTLIDRFLKAAQQPAAE